MYGRTLQEEYCAFCDVVGHRPYQDVEAVASEVADASAMALRLGLKPGHPQGTEAGGRLAAHVRALRHNRGRPMTPRTANDAKRRAISDALTDLPQPVREHFVELAIAYLGRQQSPADFLFEADPNLATVESAEQGAIIAHSGAAVFADSRLSWSTAYKYYLLARCFGQESILHDCVQSWAESRRAFDMVRLWQVLTEQQSWLGTDTDVLPAFLHVLTEHPHDPDTLATWANTTLPELVEDACRVEESYRVVDVVRVVLSQVPRLANEPAQRLTMAALRESATSRSQLQNAVQHLPQARTVLREVLSARDEDQYSDVAFWLAHNPLSELEMPLRLAHLRAEDPLVKLRLGSALAATLRPQACNHMPTLLRELESLAHSALATADCGVGAECDVHSPKNSAAERLATASTGAYVDLDRPQAWSDGTSDRPLVLPAWLRMIPVPRVRIRPEYRNPLGECFSDQALRGLLYGVVGFRFQQHDRNVQYFAQHCVPLDWELFCAWALSMFEELIVVAFETDPELEEETSWVARAKTRLMTSLRRKDPNRMHKATFYDLHEARGLLEFALHGNPVNETLRLWRVLNAKLWDESDEVNSAATEITRTLHKKPHPAALAALFDLDSLWHFGGDEYCHILGKQDIAREQNTTVSELRWSAIPEFGVAPSGSFTWFDGVDRVPCRLDSRFRLETDTTLESGEVVGGKNSPLAKRLVRTCPSELQRLLNRLRVRIRGLFRDMAARGAQLTFGEWQRRCLEHSLVRVAGQQIVWLGMVSGTPVWFHVSSEGCLESLDGAAVASSLDTVQIATCVNTPADMIDQWKTRFDNLRISNFINQFGFADTKAAVLSEGYWRLGDWDISAFIDAEVRMDVLDAWAYEHGFVEEGDDDYVCEYIRLLPGGDTVGLEIEGRVMPVDSGITTEILSVDLGRAGTLDSAYDACLSEALRQQFYTDLTELFGDTRWCSPPGVRC